MIVEVQILEHNGTWELDLMVNCPSQHLQK